MKLAIITAHAGAETLGECADSWQTYPLETRPPTFIMEGADGMLPAYQRGLGRLRQKYDILAYLHDDCLIKDQDWQGKVLREFWDEKVGLVGFGGAKEHGRADIYKAPYDYRQLGRARFMSNMEDAEVHGERFTGSTEVAVLDGFALIVRRELLERAGGWPLNTPIGYVAYDYWLCCMAHRLGYKIRLVGVACKHYGGATFVKLGKGQSAEAQKQYWDAHQYIYDEFRDVLPWRCA